MAEQPGMICREGQRFESVILHINHRKMIQFFDILRKTREYDAVMYSYDQSKQVENIGAKSII